MEDKKMATAETATTETDAKVVNSSETTNDSPEKTMDWTNRLQITPKGKIMMTPGNLIMIAENDPSLQTISYDVFHERYVATENSPFRPRKTQYLNDASLADISRHIESHYGIRISVASMEERMLTIIQRQRAFHPIQEFINTEKWDGTPRVDKLLIDYLGAKDTRLNRAMTRKWMAAAVARIFEPGIKFDHVLTLAGPQGTGKSTLLATLAEKWFSDTFSFSMDNRQQREAIQAKWIVEAAELSGLRKAEVEAAKAFISSPEDSYRAAYAHTIETHPRQCVMAATTNEEHFLRSLTGDRRWWVVDVSGNGRVEKWLPVLKANLHQIWAEAYCIYRDGEPLYLSADLEAEAWKIQQEHNVIEGSGILGELEEWINTPLPFNWDSMSRDARHYYFINGASPNIPCNKVREMVCVAEVRNEFPDKNIHNNTAQQIGKYLDLLPGWERVMGDKGEHQSRKLKVYGSQRVWRRIKPKTLF